MKIAGLRLATAGVAAAALVTLSACSSGLGGGSSSSGGSAGGGGSQTLSLLVGNDAATVKSAQAVIDAFKKANPGVDVKMETRPGGTQGDNIVKTKLSTGDMQDVFWYNSGSLLQALDPSKTLVDLTGDPAIANVDPAFFPVVSQGGKVYGGPFGTAFGGGILYNKDVYSKLGLQIPKTWNDFLANAEKIKASGNITPVIETFKAPDTWTSQLFVLGDYYNVQTANPNFAKDYTANKIKYATDPNAIKGFQKLAEVKAKGLVNSNYGSATQAQGMKMLGSGQGAMYPMLSNAVALIPAAQAQKIGFFGIPGDDASKAGATVWEPGGAYIPKASKNVDLAKKFIAFMNTKEGTDAYSQGTPPTGPYLVKGYKLPADAPPVAADLQNYINSKAFSPALEFLSPVKGPSLEQICVAVGTGQTSPQQGAAQYDQDVTKEAKQLGLPGW